MTNPVMHMTSEVSPLPKVSTLEEDYDEPLTKQLFSSELEGVVTPAWNELVTQKWRSLTRNSLLAEQREHLV